MIITDDNNAQLLNKFIGGRKERYRRTGSLIVGRLLQYAGELNTKLLSSASSLWLHTHIICHNYDSINFH